MTISKGIAVTIDGASSDSMDSAVISSSQMLVTYNDPASTLSARVVDITTSTKSIDTVNAQQTIEAYGFGIDRCCLVRFSSTKFLSVIARAGSFDSITQVLNVSGTTVTGATSLTLSDAYDPSSVILRVVTSTTAIVLYQVSLGTTKARILSIDGSDNITEGAELEVEVGTGNAFDAELFTVSKAIYVFQDDDDSNYLKAQLITISGTSLSKDGSVQTLNGTNSSSSPECCVAAISSTEVVVGYSELASDVLGCHVVSLSGSTLSVGSLLSIPTGQHKWPARAIATNSTTILMAGQSGTVSRITQIIKSGTVLSYTTNDFVDSTKISGLNRETLTYIEDDYAFSTYPTSTDSVIIGSDAATTASPDEFDIPALSQKNVDVDADGSYIYIAAINSLGFPIVIKLETSLDFDGVTVFDPGTGDDIGVQCGRFDAGVVWTAGNFGGTDVVEKSEDAGSSFSVKDPAIFGDVTAFVVGPQDERVLVVDDTVDIQETADDGDNWTEKNSAIGFSVNALARFSLNLNKIVLGNDSAVNDNIDYSINTGEGLEDYSNGFPQSDVTSIVVR